MYIYNVGVDRSCLRRLRLGIIKPCWKSDDIKRFPEDLTRKSPEDWMSRRATLPEVSPEESRKSQNPEDWISSGALFRKTELRRENFCGQDLLRPILCCSLWGFAQQRGHWLRMQKPSSLCFSLWGFAQQRGQGWGSPQRRGHTMQRPSSLCFSL